MSQNALRIIGFDEETHHPVHIELILVTHDQDAERTLTLADVSAPRGFLPDACMQTNSVRASQGLTSCQVQVFGGAGGDRRVTPTPMTFAAPRGFISG